MLSSLRPLRGPHGVGLSEDCGRLACGLDRKARGRQGVRALWHSVHWRVLSPNASTDPHPKSTSEAHSIKAATDQQQARRSMQNDTKRLTPECSKTPLSRALQNPPAASRALKLGCKPLAQEKDRDLDLPEAVTAAEDNPDRPKTYDCCHVRVQRLPKQWQLRRSQP